jgi:hypothetical protein
MQHMCHAVEREMQAALLVNQKERGHTVYLDVDGHIIIII